MSLSGQNCLARTLNGSLARSMRPSSTYLARAFTISLSMHSNRVEKFVLPTSCGLPGAFQDHIVLHLTSLISWVQVQGDTSGRTKPPVDIKTKELILKRNCCFDVNGRFGPTWCVTLYNSYQTYLDKRFPMDAISDVTETKILWPSRWENMAKEVNFFSISIMFCDPDLTLLLALKLYDVVD